MTKRSKRGRGARRSTFARSVNLMTPTRANVLTGRAFLMKRVWASSERFSIYRSKIKREKFQKTLDKHQAPCYNDRAKKQNVPCSHPAAKERARLIGHLFGCILSCGAYALRDFLFHRVNPGNGGTVLLALQKNC